MDSSSPFFLRLFRRSHYVRLLDGDESEQAKIAREERERFAVAALAFCLRHDSGFLNHFWERICRTAKDSADPPRLHSVLLEPPCWADLRLIGETGGKRYVCVLEVKAGAPLDPKQRPDRSDFVVQGTGYAALFAESEKGRNTQMRYVVLGSNETDHLEVGPGAEILNIQVQKRGWQDLLTNLPWEGIVGDFCRTMSELGIHPFHMEEAKSIHVSSGLTNVGDAYKVLLAICDWLGVRRAYRHFEADSDDDRAGGHMGFYIDAPPGKKRPGKLHVQLQRATREEGWCLSWFGYRYGPLGKVVKFVWFYRDTKAKQHQLLKKVAAKYPSAETWDDNEDHIVMVDSGPHDVIGDVRWFQDVFKAAIL